MLHQNHQKLSLIMPDQTQLKQEQAPAAPVIEDIN